MKLIAPRTEFDLPSEAHADAPPEHRADGWTDFTIGPDRPVRVVDGLLTGMHAPPASHLLMLEAIAGPALVAAAYAAALRERYLWHEVGDSTLFLP